MKVLELFAGTRSVGRAFEKRGHEVFSIDWDKSLENIDMIADIGSLTSSDILNLFGRPDVIWASPDCTSYSVAAIGKHRKQNKNTGELEPVTDYAKFCDKVNRHVVNLIMELKPTFYFIENPRGGLRKMSFVSQLPRYTVTYCQYTKELPLEQRRMKPTDIWTNHPSPCFFPPCKNGDDCHVKAPRGSKTGTQGIIGAKQRATIPKMLCEHIVDICESEINETHKLKTAVLDTRTRLTR